MANLGSLGSPGSLGKSIEVYGSNRISVIGHDNGNDGLDLDDDNHRLNSIEVRFLVSSRVSWSYFTFFMNNYNLLF